jgi:heat shock protein HslJ
MDLPTSPASCPSGTRRTVSRALMAACAAALIAGSALPLAATAQDRAEDRAQEPQDVEGPIWQLLKYREDGELTLVPPGLGADLYLWANEVRGTGACNPFDSTYTVGRDRLTIFPPEVQPATCDPEAAGLDEILLRLLAEVSSWAIAGSQMTLADAAGEELLTFTNARVPEDPTIAPWRLSRVVAPDGAVTRAVEGGDAIVRFLPGGRVAGRSGCGPLLGSYTTNGATIDITDLQSRLTDCSGDIRTQAEQLIASLPEMSDFTLRPAGLSLADPAGSSRLAFVPDIAVTQQTWTPTEVLDRDGEVLLDEAKLAASSIRFGATKIDGRSPCRLYHGDNLRAGLALSLFGLQEEGPCKLPDDEAAFIDALSNVASHALRGGNLELLDQDGAAVMKLQPQPSIDTVDWQLSKMSLAGKRGRKTKLLPTPSEEPLTATFRQGGIAFGETGVTSFNARYDAGGSSIKIEEPTPSGSFCSGRKNKNRPECRLQATYLDYLDDADQYIVKEDMLRLYDGTRPLLEFAPSTTIEAEQAAEDERARQDEEADSRS